jgi:hypothetical protein
MCWLMPSARRVVCEEGAQYRSEPRWESRVYEQKWWDEEEEKKGPKCGWVLINVCPFPRQSLRRIHFLPHSGPPCYFP